ncbi:hypothetical protein [Tsukamurella pseudospumae]|uniref:Uncharacterized protein n=1 Tax=Tsukamurella pseudospumae TaxID=239498 RepID=A0A137YWY3_9ACTN|nr:hypothetical protein [Tsukamurella pseudospumae]KXO90457.1 hypothetical protein AXK61_07510 [Tsukamurella pseudospumae]
MNNQRPSWTRNPNNLVIAGIGAIAVLVVALLVVIVAISNTGGDTTAVATATTTDLGDPGPKANLTTTKGKPTSAPTADVAPDEFAPTAPGTYDPQGPKQWRPKGTKASDPTTGGLIFKFRSADNMLNCSASKRELVCQARARNNAEANTRIDTAQKVCSNAAPGITRDAIALTLTDPLPCIKTIQGDNDTRDWQTMPDGTFAWVPSPKGDAWCTMSKTAYPEDYGRELEPGTKFTSRLECSTTNPTITHFTLAAFIMKGL